MTQILVDLEQLDSETLAAVDQACTRRHAEVMPLGQVRENLPDAALIVGALRRGERRLPQRVVELMTRLPDARVMLLSDDPLIRPSVTTHGGRVTLLARPTSMARICGTLRMLLGERSEAEHLDAEVWTAIVRATGAEGPKIRRDDSTLTALFPLEAGWSGAEELCEEADLIAQAAIDEDERQRRLRDMLGDAAGMLHLSARCRSWVTYWPSSRNLLLLCSPVRLPRICNIADGVSKQVVTLNASPGDVVVALGPEAAQASGLDQRVADGGAALVEHIEGLGGLTSPALVVEVR